MTPDVPTSDVRGLPSPDPTLDPPTARVHAAEYRLLSQVEGGLAEAWARHRDEVGHQQSLLFRTLDLAAVGARRRAAHYAALAKVLQSYADAPSADPDPVLAQLGPLVEAQTERFLGGDLADPPADPSGAPHGPHGA